MRKMSNLAIWTPFWEVWGDARPWLMVHWKAHAWVSMHVKWTLVCYLLRFRNYETKCVQLDCFHRGVDLFAFNFYLDMVVRHQPHSQRQKTRDIGLPDGKDHIPLRSLILTHYQSVTDGRICHSIYSACKAMLCKNYPLCTDKQCIH